MMSQIKAINRASSLPSLKITPAYRSDGSGTSYNFTDYLSKVSSEFASQGRQVDAAAVPARRRRPRQLRRGRRRDKSTPGAIGYADVAYALNNKLRFAKVKNKAGAFATPGIRGAVAAAATIKSIPADNAISIVDPPASAAKLAYPIATYTWVIVPLQSKNAKPLKQFLLFAISKAGQALGMKLLYAPIPDAVRLAAAKSIAKVKQAS